MGIHSREWVLSNSVGIVVGFSLMMCSVVAEAVSFGEIEVHSRLGERLKATIPVSATPAEFEELEVRMASQLTFDRLGIEGGAMVEALLIKLVMNNDEPQIQITSKGMVREPLFEFVLSAYWANGQITRVFPVFLSP